MSPHTEAAPVDPRDELVLCEMQPVQREYVFDAARFPVATATEIATAPVEPAYFVWRGKYRAEFVALDAARAWQREHGGVLAWLCDDCDAEHIGAKACCVCHGHFAVEDGDGGAGYCACPAAQAKSDEDAAYWEGQLRGVPARDVLSEGYMAENGIDPDEVAVPR